MDPETQALLQYLSTNFGLGAQVPNVNMELPFANEPLPPSRLAPPTVAAGPAPAPTYSPDMNATFGAAGVPNPASMPAEALPQSGGVPPYSGRTGTSLGELLRSKVEGVGQAAVDYMRPRVTPPAAPAPLPPTTPIPAIPGLPFYVPPKTDLEAGRVPPASSYTPGPAVVADQTPAPADTQAQVKQTAPVGGNKLIDALRGVVTPKLPEAQKPIPTREVQPHKIESTIAMLTSLGITPKDLMHIPSLGASLRG